MSKAGDSGGLGVKKWLIIIVLILILISYFSEASKFLSPLLILSLLFLFRELFYKLIGKPVPPIIANPHHDIDDPGASFRETPDTNDSDSDN